MIDEAEVAGTSPAPTDDCKWCHEAAGDVLIENGSFIAVFDGYPVNRGHTLIISKG